MTENNTTNDIDRLLLQWQEHESAMLCTRLADMFRRAKRLEEAVNLALKGLDKWVGNTSITIVLARTYRDAGDLDKSNEYFKQVYEKQPRNLVVLKNLGEISYTKGHLNKAAQYFGDYLAEHPGDDDIREKLDSIRSTSIRIPSKEPLEEVITTLDDDIQEIEEDISDNFPKTERMAKVLREQGITPEEEKEEKSVIVEAVKDEENPNLSLLDFFSVEEREKYGLKPYIGEKQ